MFELVSKGGYVIITIMACSLVAFTVIIERWLFYRAADASARRFQKFCQEPGAADVADSNSSGAASTIFEKMWEAAARLPEGAQEQRQLAVDDTVRSEIPRLESNLYVLTTAATIAPLLGLLGTVLGMIKTFQAASMTGLGNPQMLAEGISEALYNTAGGLMVAIPCIMANNHFRSRVERLIHWTEGCAGEIVRRAHS